MKAAYAKAAIPEPFQILGLRLKPFCIGHYLHMSRFNVAFVSDEDEPATFNDLVLGVLICSKTYEEFLEFLNQPDTEEQITKWGQECQLFDMAEKVALFSKYIADGSVMPKFWEEESGRPSGAHWTQSVKLILTSELGYTNSEAINLPLPQAFLDFFKFCEGKGTVRLLTEAEIEMIEAAKKQQEAPCPV